MNIKQRVCEINGEEGWGLTAQEAKNLAQKVIPHVEEFGEPDELVKNFIISYYQKLYNLVSEVNNAKEWGKSPQEIKQLTNDVIPYVDPLDAQTRESIKRNVIANYERDGPLVKGLMESNPSSAQNQRILEFRDYMTRVAQKRYTDSLEELRLEAEDLVSYAWIDILTNLNSFRFESRLTTWAFPIIRNRCLQLLRIRRLELLPLEEAFGVSAHDYIGQEMLSSELFKIVSAEIERFCRNMRKSDISVETKILIGLKRFIEDKTNQEIAEELCINYNTVTTIINRIKRHLQRVLSQICV